MRTVYASGKVEFVHLRTRTYTHTHMHTYIAVKEGETYIEDVAVITRYAH